MMLAAKSATVGAIEQGRVGSAAARARAESPAIATNMGALDSESEPVRLAAPHAYRRTAYAVSARDYCSRGALGRGLNQVGPRVLELFELSASERARDDATERGERLCLCLGFGDLFFG